MDILVLVIIAIIIISWIKKTKKQRIIPKLKPEETFDEYITRSDEEMDDDNYESILHGALCQIKVLNEATSLSDINKSIVSIQSVINEIKNIYNSTSHGKHVKKAILEYKTNGDGKIFQYQINFAYKPFNLDLESLKKERYTEIVNNYEHYWELQISRLVRKNAIQSRRKYLVVKIEEMILDCSKSNYLDLVPILLAYKTKQISLIAITEKAAQ